MTTDSRRPPTRRAVVFGVVTWTALTPSLLATDWDQADPRWRGRGERLPERQRCIECWEPVQPGPRAGRNVFCSARCRSRWRSREWRRTHGAQVREWKRQAYAANPEPTRAAANGYRASKAAEAEARLATWTTSG